MKRPFYIYVDVDETFIRNYAAKQIPIPDVIKHIKELKKDGAILYCWSSGGAEYAKNKAEEFGIGDCFIGFLPKPMVMIDDVKLAYGHTLAERLKNRSIVGRGVLTPTNVYISEIFPKNMVSIPLRHLAYDICRNCS